ncbi:MAG: retropepsin-like domain-containing protein [Bradymonadaceae bacterium]|nr:retropepsin-like domain-containing protein [Lujinxingiaceae bacterium]
MKSKPMCWFWLGIFGLFIAFGSSTATAQDVRDLFENQETLSESVLVIQGSTGEVGSDMADPRIERVGRGGAEAIRLPFERRAGAILVKARVQERDVYFMVDTGATFTTLTTSFAREAGISPRAQNPTTVVRTANGNIATQFGIIANLELGDRRHSRVSFIICDSCGDERIEGRPLVGVLGLNVLRRYRVSIDDTAGVVELASQQGFANQRHDIEPWLMVAATQGVVNIERHRSEIRWILHTRNLSVHDVRELEVALSCQLANGEQYSERVRVAQVAANKSRETTIVKPPLECLGMEAHVEAASW